MGLDIYVGTLTRYLRGDWETIVQRLSREGRLPPVHVVRPGGDDAPPPPEEQVRSLVVNWRTALSRAVRREIPDGLDWDEDRTEYFTDKPAWEPWWHLLLWTAHSEHPDLALPRTLEGEPTENPAYARAQEATDYPHLLSGVEWWLPCSFSLVFQAQDGGGAERTFGSSIALVNELRDLNTRTWNADAATIGRWYEKGPPEPGCAVEDGARFAFGMLVDLGEKSVKLRLPMLLDY